MKAWRKLCGGKKGIGIGGENRMRGRHRTRASEGDETTEDRVKYDYRHMPLLPAAPGA